jgi:hypothetical protein
MLKIMHELVQNETCMKHPLKFMVKKKKAHVILTYGKIENTYELRKPMCKPPGADVATIK